MGGGRLFNEVKRTKKDKKKKKKKKKKENIAAELRREDNQKTNEILPMKYYQDVISTVRTNLPIEN
jgi:hypothetical protein